MHIFYNDETPNEVLGTPEDVILKRELIEMFPDPGYELESIHPDDLEILEKVREHFGDRGHYPVGFKELKNVMYHKCKEKFNRNMFQMDFLVMMRSWWRAGHTRRFIIGRSGKRFPAGRGGWFGVHYILYPNKEYNERSS